MRTHAEALFEVDELLERCLDGVEFSCEILSIFQQQVPKLSDQLDRAAASGAAAEAAKAAHQLKGSCAYLSARHARDLAAALEEQLRLGEVAAVGILHAETRVAILAAHATIPEVMSRLLTGGNETCA